MNNDQLLGLVDMTNEQYHSAPGISKSHLDCINEKSPKHYWHKYINPEREPYQPTPAMQIGTAIHTLILEPNLVDETIVRGLEIDRRSNENKRRWAEFEQEHAGKIILKNDDYDHVLRVRDAVHAHPIASGLLTGGRAEQSYFAMSPVPSMTDSGYMIDQETGEVIHELIKCRTDYIHDGGNLIVDVKSTEDASRAGFGKSATNYRYDVQVAWYYHVFECAFGWTPENWAFIALEKTEPYAIGVYFATRPQIEVARNAAMRDFARIVHHRRINQWPDYGYEIVDLELAPWIKR